MPDFGIDLVNTRACRYQKEEKATKIIFLNRQMMTYGWDNAELDDTESLLLEQPHPDITD